MHRILTGLVLLLAWGCAAAMNCPGDKIAVTKKGHFGAPTIHGYRELIHLQTRHNVEELLALVRNGSLVRLPAGEEVCIRNSTRLSYRTLITMDDLDGAYWVHLNALDWDW